MQSALAIHEATIAGDLDRLREAYGNPDDFPNSRAEGGDLCLEYAIYHGPLSLVRALLELGADPNYASDDGFPSLFAAIDRDAPDRYEVLELLLAAGADVQQRGLNDWTALHRAACCDDPVAVELLLRHGADPYARTRIDDYATPLEEAERLGYAAGAAALRHWLEGRKPPE